MRSWSSDGTASSIARISSRSVDSAAGSRSACGSKRSSKRRTSRDAMPGLAANASFWYSSVKPARTRWRYLR